MRCYQRERTSQMITQKCSCSSLVAARFVSWGRRVFPWAPRMSTKVNQVEVRRSQKVIATSLVVQCKIRSQVFQGFVGFGSVGLVRVCSKKKL